MSTETADTAKTVGTPASPTTGPEPPKPSFLYRSDEGPAQQVCELSATARLQDPAFAGFPDTAGTICVWLKVPATAALDASVLTYQPPAASGAPRLSVLKPQNLEIRIGDRSSGPIGVLLADDVWRQLAITYEHTKTSAWIISVYLDALPVWRSRSLRSKLPCAPGGTLALGWDGQTGGDLPGLAAELQVWKKALSERDLATGLLRRAVTGTGTETDPALHWPLDVAPPQNPNAKIVPSQLRFRTGVATVSWPAIPGATGYSAEAGATDGLWNAKSPSEPLPGPAWTPPNVPLAARIGTRYRAQMATGPGLWSAVTGIRAFELGTSAVTPRWTEATKTLLATWPDVPRRTSYTLELFKESEAEPTSTQSEYTELSYALTDKLDAPEGWRLDVRAFATGSLGPAEPSLPFTAPTLDPVRYDLPAKVLTLKWAEVTGAQYFRLRITPASGRQQPYTAMIAGDAVSTTVPDTAYQLLPGIGYTVALRALGGGTLTGWATATVTVHDVPAPILAWASAPAPALLNATWSQVAAGAAYDLKLYQGTGPTPIKTETGLTARQYSLAPHLDDNDTFTVKVAALDSGIEGPTNNPVPVTPLGLVWQYLVETQTLKASWAPAQPEAYLRPASSAANQPAPAIGTGGEATFPAPLAEFPDGTRVTLNGRALAPGTLGPIENAAALTIHRLATPTPELSYHELLPAAADAEPDAEPRMEPDATAAAAGTLTLGWTAATPPPTVAYQELTTVNGTPRPIQDVTGSTLDVTPLLETAGAITLAVRGTADGSIGAWSAATAPAAPVWQSTTYDVVNGEITAAWTAPAGLHAVGLDLTHSGAPAADERKWLPGTATTATLPVPSAQIGKDVTLRLRAVAAAALSDFAPKPMTLLRVPGPVLSPLTDRVNPNSVTAAWSFDPPSGTATTGYVVELSTGSTVLATKSVDDPAVKSATFDETGSLQFHINTLYTVRVRARVQPAPGESVLGEWSAAASINFGADVDLTLSTLSANSDTAAAITLGWQLRTPVTGVTFEVFIVEVDFRRTGITDTGVTYTQAQTGVVADHVYTVRVRAVLGPNTGPWLERQVTAGKPPDPAPGPSRNDPILIRTGTLYRANVDLLVPAVVPLAFTVAYRSDSPLPTDHPGLPSTPLGNRWNHVYNTRITKAPDGKSVALVGGDTYIVVYDVPSSITGAHPQRGIPNGSTLFAESDLSYTLTRADGSRARFDPSGAMQWLADPAGNRTTLTYTGGRLHRVTDDGSRRWLEFTYNGDGRITAVTASTNVSIGYGYDPKGDLTSATDPLLGPRTFTYDAASRMTDVTDQLRRPALHNVYDTRGRITLQQDANALAEHQAYGTTFAYSSAAGVETVVVTDRENQVTSYTFDAVGGGMLSETLQLSPTTVRRVSYTRDANGNALTTSVFEGAASSTDPGLKWTATYDGIGNVTSVTDPLNGTVSTVYDNACHPIRITDRLGNTTVLEWTGNLLHKVTDPVGGQTVRTYAPGPISGLLATETDPYGAVATFTYDEAGQLTKIVDATGAVTVPAWDAKGWPAGYSRQTAAGDAVFTLETEANAMGHPTLQRERYAGQPATRPFTTRIEYAPTGTTSWIQDALQAETDFEYDPDLLPTKIVYPTATTPADRTIYGYDRENRPTSADYGAGVAESFGYDAADRPVLYTDPRHNSWHAVYAVSGKNLVQTVTLPVADPDTGRPLTTEAALDPLGRTVSRKDTGGGVTGYTYETVPIAGTNTFGQRITTTLPPVGTPPAAITRSQTFDCLGRLAESVTEDGKATTYAYALAATVTDPPPGAVVAVTMTRPTNVTEQYLLDGAGRLLQVRRGTGAQQRRASRTYDPLGRVVSTSHQGGTMQTSATCAYTWDDGAVVATVSTASATPTPATKLVLRYDPLGRLLAAQDRAGKSVTYTHTPSGLMDTCTNARGQKTTYTHDAAARLTHIAPPDASAVIEHVLDENGNRTSTLVDNVATITRTFDPLNRLTSRTAGGATVGFGYAAGGGIEKVTYPGPSGQPAPEVHYLHDALGRLTSVRDWAQRTTTFGYLRTGALSWQESPNGVRTDAGFDDDGRLTSLTTSVQNLVIALAEYGYDPFDAPVTLREVLPAPAVPAPGARTLSYDGDRLTAVDGVALTYDDDGNMVGAPGLPAPLAYDVFDELTGAGAASVRWDADGLPAAVTTAGKTTAFAYDPGGYRSPRREQADLVRATASALWQPLPTGGVSLTPVAQSAIESGAPGGAGGQSGTGAPDGTGTAGQAPGLAGAAVAGSGFVGLGLTGPWLAGPAAGGSFAAGISAERTAPAASAATAPAWSAPLAALDRRLVASSDGHSTRYVHGLGLIGAELPDGDFASHVFDANGDTVALVLPDGTLTGRQTYDAFGTVLGGDAAAGPFGLGGRFGATQDVSGLVSMRARAYAPSLLRFTGQDPLYGVLSDPQSLNRYSYLRGAPLLRVDPLGLDGFPLWGKLLAGAGVVAVVVVGAGITIAGAYSGAAVGGGAAGVTATGLGAGLGATVDGVGTTATNSSLRSFARMWPPSDDPYGPGLRNRVTGEFIPLDRLGHK